MTTTSLLKQKVSNYGRSTREIVLNSGVSGVEIYKN